MALLEVNDLHTSFFTDAGEVKAVDGVSFRLDHGKVLGIVGESGSGKSVTAYSVMQILAPTGKIVSGSVKFDGQELVGADEKLLRSVRGNRISIIFQDPMTSLNPTYTIGRQLMEAILLHTDRNRRQARERAVEMLKPDPDPHGLHVPWLDRRGHHDAAAERDHPEGFDGRQDVYRELGTDRIQHHHGFERRQRSRKGGLHHDG